MRILVPEAKTYFPGAGFCIYCGRRPPGVPRLTREHIIPFAFRGQLILHQASCDECAKIINSEIETPCIGHFIAARTTLKLNNIKVRPENLKYASWDGERGSWPISMGDANSEWNEAPSDKMPLMLVLPWFDGPTILNGGIAHEGFTLRGAQFYNDGKRLPRAPDGRVEGAMLKHSPNLFCRMIAKIAHGAAVAEIGTDLFRPLLPEIILGKEKKISHLIGSAPYTPRKRASKHQIELRLHSGFIIADVQLFANLAYRPYRAVVGLAAPHLTKWHISTSSKSSMHAA